MANFLQPTLGNEEHIREALGVIQHFLSKGPMMLTNSTCLKLLNQECSCGRKHNKQFVSQCASKISYEPSLVLRKQRLFEFGYENVLKLVSFAVDSLFSDPIEGAPLVTDRIKSDIIAMFENSQETMRSKMSNTESIDRDQCTNVWVNRYSDDTDSWDDASQKLLAGCVGLYLNEDKIYFSFDRPIMELHRFLVLNFKLRGLSHHSAICPFEWHKLEGPYRYLLENIHDFLRDSEGHTVKCIIHLFCLKQTVDWFAPLPFDVGTLLNLPSQETHLCSQITTHNREDCDRILKQHGIVIHKGED